MAKEKPAFKLVTRKTSPVTKAALLAAAVLSMVALVALYSAIDHLHDQYDALRQEALELESNNGQLQEQIGELGTLESVIRIAGEILGLIDPDSVIFAPNND